ncbi:hypothetical protein R3X26_17295 [Vibrio sp. TH_r3]|uniref:hypothetical protein n=1 Tax=Vibrio sp. TH_r3 TaxID=3082084 RepID=UPI00295313A7|nr:hypothetical protein [Vibrio sp. TH_r3]MDV7106155.1 hypothetical protein [Vibrio sp. TH_r3]
MNILIKWVLIVVANSIYAFNVAVNSGEFVVSGIILGIATWIIIYVLLDTYLAKKGYVKQSKQLTISTCLRIPLQLFSIIDFYAGFAAINTVELIFPWVSSALVGTYLGTVCTGFYLSLVCGIILLFVHLVAWLAERASKSNETGKI